jgi:membrane protease YdiL (CAAX protease family)
MRALLLDPFVLPFLAFMAFLVLEGVHPNAVYFLYPVKTLVVGGLILWQWKKLPTLKPSQLLLSLLVGLVVVVGWIGLDPWAYHFSLFLADQINQSLHFFGVKPLFKDLNAPRAGFAAIQFNPLFAWPLITFRLLGASLVVPIMEELFWRGFLMRYLIKEDYRSIPLGTYQPFAFWITTACFASVHGAQWPLAALTGLFYGGLFLKTKNLGNVMVAHGFTNFFLGLYVVQTQRWYFW